MTTKDQPNLGNQVTQYGNKMEEYCFYFTAILFMLLAVILTTVDVKLLLRLKESYTTFYYKEKCKVGLPLPFPLQYFRSSLLM